MPSVMTPAWVIGRHHHWPSSFLPPAPRSGELLFQFLNFLPDLFSSGFFQCSDFVLNCALVAWFWFEFNLVNRRPSGVANPRGPLRAIPQLFSPH